MYITYKYLKAHIFNKRERETERKRGIQIEKKEYREREREGEIHRDTVKKNNYFR